MACLPRPLGLDARQALQHLPWGVLPLLWLLFQHLVHWVGGARSCVHMSSWKSPVSSVSSCYVTFQQNLASGTSTHLSCHSLRGQAFCHVSLSLESRNKVTASWN